MNKKVNQKRKQKSSVTIKGKRYKFKCKCKIKALDCVTPEMWDAESRRINK